MTCGTANESLCSKAADRLRLRHTAIGYIAFSAVDRFGGNAETALDWLERLKECRLDAGGFLLVDYPGYGVCLGNPSADSILENAIEAYHACIESKRWIIRRPRLGVLGRSIGAAVVYSARNQTYGFGFEGPPDRSTKPSPVRYAPRGYRVSHRSIHIRDRYDRPG